MKRIYIIFSAALFAAGALSGCKKVLEKDDLTRASPDFVFSNITLATQSLDFVYGQNQPGWYGSTVGSTPNTGLCEEAYNDNVFIAGTNGAFSRNSVTDLGSNYTKGNNYNKIDIINTFLRDLAAGTLAQSDKNLLAAQARFWRAYRYFDLVRLYGGVPLVLVPLDAVGDAAKKADLLPRNLSSECIKQIVADLDFGIANLPAKYATPAKDYGRITSEAAAAFKGRVLLTWASPEFNPTNDQQRWKDAADANNQAVKLATDAGYKLMPDYANLWFVEGYTNTEALMVTGYNQVTADQGKNNNTYDNSTRPAYTGTGTSSASNQPTFDMVASYPQKDGKMYYDNTSAYYVSGTASAADASKLAPVLYKNRDPRFDKTIAFNGATWPLNGNTNYRLWTYFVGSKSVEPTGSTSTGFYLRKAIDPTLATSSVVYSGNDWIEIRYAEVLLNQAECAAETGDLATALKNLRDIRARAGIESGGGTYGLSSALGHDDMILAIMNERKIELAYEGKRFWDLRRRNMLNTLNGVRRTGVKFVTNGTAPTSLTASPYNGRDAVTIDQAYTYFTISTVTLDTKYAIGFIPASMAFFGIPDATITNDPNILQNNNWGGTFDPTK